MCTFRASHTGKVILVERKLQVSKGMVTISGHVSKQKQETNSRSFHT